MRRSGYTLVELTLILVIIGLVGVNMGARFLDISERALASAKIAMTGAVKSAHSLYYMEMLHYPTVTQLSERVIGSEIVAEPTGLRVTINNHYYVVPTYRDETRTILTTSVSDEVQCVGEIP